MADRKQGQIRGASESEESWTSDLERPHGWPKPRSSLRKWQPLRDINRYTDCIAPKTKIYFVLDNLDSQSNRFVSFTKSKNKKLVFWWWRPKLYSPKPLLLLSDIRFTTELPVTSVSWILVIKVIILVQYTDDYKDLWRQPLVPYMYYTPPFA